MMASSYNSCFCGQNRLDIPLAPPARAAHGRCPQRACASGFCYIKLHHLPREHVSWWVLVRSAVLATGAGTDAAGPVTMSCSRCCCGHCCRRRSDYLVHHDVFRRGGCDCLRGKVRYYQSLNSTVHGSHCAVLGKLVFRLITGRFWSTRRAGVGRCISLNINGPPPEPPVQSCQHVIDCSSTHKRSEHTYQIQQQCSFQ